jgi:hypothetical protein
MKTSRFFLAAIAVLLGLLIPTPVFGASKKKPSPTPSQAPTISSVSADSITVTEPKGAKTLAITQFTEITVNGQRATAAELKPGMTVTIALGTDPSKASRINATGK